MVSQQFTCCICLPKDQSVKKLPTKARAPTEGPERQEVTDKGPNAYRRTRASRSYQQKARVPTEGPEHQEVINRGQSAYRRTRASRSYQQKDRSAKMERTTNDRHDGNHTRIGRSYTMVVPMNISSHGEVGDPTVKVDKGKGRTRPLIRTTTGSKEADHETTCNEKLRHLMHDKH